MTIAIAKKILMDISFLFVFFLSCLHIYCFSTKNLISENKSKLFKIEFLAGLCFANIKNIMKQNSGK